MTLRRQPERPMNKKVYYSLSIRRNGRKIKMIKIELSREGLEINVSGIELIVYAEAGK